MEAMVHIISKASHRHSIIHLQKNHNL